ncbi:hypothetical protein EWM64_g5632 [Hericium alpestre]|uniref:BTB domain-containing protein n=1 Tax=Hericium alpestre TaxID=135208 RepID=A0A4Y9ZWT9_9AGAM|nr:hypothetical protein EWM64_g5632 [Hericium alpestre]
MASPDQAELLRARREYCSAEALASKTLKVVTADAPFNDPNADIVLRSYDRVDFRTYKMILSMASPVFRDIFTLPQPLPESRAESAVPASAPRESCDSVHDISTTEGELSSTTPTAASPELTIVPVTTLAEDCKTMLFLLTAICPVPTQAPDSYEEMLGVLAAAQKYEMTGALADFRAFTKPTFDTIPHNIALRVFGLACRYKLREEASVAAWRTLGTTMSLESYDSDLKFVTGSALYELMQYRRSCESAVVSVIAGIQNDLKWLVGEANQHRCADLAKRGKRIETLDDDDPPTWWINYWSVVLEGLKSGRVFPTAQSTIDQLSFHDSLRGHGWKLGAMHAASCQMTLSHPFV